jgi:hypothetical protein
VVTPADQQEIINAVGTTKPEQRLSADFGLTMKRKLSDKFSVSLGIGAFYSRVQQELTLTENVVQGYTTQNTNGQLWYQTNLVVNRLNIDQTRWLSQLSIGTQFRPGKTSGFYLQGGTTVYYQVVLTEKVTSNNQEISNAESQARFGSTSDQPLNIGFNVGFGYSLKLAGQRQVQIEPEYRFMLNSFNFGNSLIKSQPQLYGVGLKYYW